MAVYSRYVLPSLQFHFAVHNIHKTHLDLLDASARKFLKSWLGFPKRGATDLGIFHPNILGVKYPSQVYLLFCIFMLWSPPLEGLAGKIIEKANINVEIFTLLDVKMI